MQPPKLHMRSSGWQFFDACTKSENELCWIATYRAESCMLQYWCNRLNKPFATSHACSLFQKSRKSHAVLTLLYVCTALAFTTKSPSAAFLQFIDVWCGLVIKANHSC